jgi:hypothetical protein
LPPDHDHSVIRQPGPFRSITHAAGRPPSVATRWQFTNVQPL